MKVLIKAAFLAAGCGLAAISAPAQQPAAEDDIASHIISVPVPARYRVDGLRNGGRVHSDATVQGGKSLRIEVPGRSEQVWSVAVSVPITAAVHANDELVLAFWARLERGENGATSAELPYNAVQLASAPYTQVFGGPATIGPEWHMFEIHGRATQDYAAGALNVAMHLATGHQTIDIGPVFVLNMGQ